LGFYFFWLCRKADGCIGEEWMSLWDEHRLEEMVDAGDEWYVSKGLFVPPPVATNILQDFIQSGRRSVWTKWTTPNLMPANSNW